MNQAAEDSITAMLNCFPQTAQNYELLLETLERLLAGHSDQAIIDGAMRYASGKVPGQSKTFAPSAPEFVEEVGRQQEFLAMKARPRLAPPVYRSGPLMPFEVAKQKALSANSHLPVLFEGISFDEFRKLSALKQIPTGAKWVAAVAIVYGPPAAQARAA